jgi:hypothetical protein
VQAPFRDWDPLEQDEALSIEQVVSQYGEALAQKLKRKVGLAIN